MGNTQTPRKSLTNTPREDVNVMKTVAQVAKLFRQADSHVLIWHDPYGHLQQNKIYLDEMESLSTVKLFNDWNAAVAAIAKTQTHCHVITSGINGEILCDRIYNMRNVVSISVFCPDAKDHKKWAKKCFKVICVESNFDKLMEKLSNIILEYQQLRVNLRMDFPCFAPIFDDTDKSEVTKRHFYLNGLVGFQNHEQSKEEFLSLASVLYKDKDYIEHFRKTYNKYNMKSILNWYTKESFLYKITNNCLRIGTSDTILYCKLVLRDLVTAIKEQYQKKSKEFNGLLFRGAYISPKEWAQLEQNIGKPIEMLGFLSTTRVSDVALSFAKEDIKNKAMITIIVPPAPDLNEYGFAEMKEFSDYKKEEEVLFNVMSRFTILKAGVEKINGVECRHLVLLYGAQSMRKLLASQKSEIAVVVTKKERLMCTVCKADILQTCKKFFYINPLDKKESVCEKCVQIFASKNSSPLLYVPLMGMKSSTDKIIDVKLEGIAMKYNEPLKIPFYGYKCKMCRTSKLNKDTWYHKCLTCKASIKKWCKECFSKNPDCLTSKHQIILETSPYVFWTNKMTKDELEQLNFVSKQLATDHGTYQQAETFYNTHDYRKAAQCYEGLLKQDIPQKDFDRLYYGLASSYIELGEYKNAFLYAKTCLDRRKRAQGEKYIQLPEAYDCLGTVYYRTASYQNALEHFQKAFEIRIEVFGEVAEKHPKVAESYTNLGLVYRDLADYPKAMEHFKKSLEIRKAVYEGNNPHLAESYSNIGLVYYQQGEYKKALEHHTKALEIRKALYVKKHPKVANSYNNIALVYNNMKEYNNALDYHSKALEIRKEIFGENHSSIAESYNNMGLAYTNLGQYDQALQHHSNSLTIKQKVYGEKHPKTAHSYNNLGIVYHNMKDYIKAIEFHTKALEVRKVFYTEKHPQIADSYNNIGLSQSFLGEENEGMKNLMKSLQIRRTFFGEKHSQVAHSYSNLDLVQSLKSLKIRQSFYGIKELETEVSCDDIDLTQSILVESRQSMKSKPKQRFSVKPLNLKTEMFDEKYSKTSVSTRASLKSLGRSNEELKSWRFTVHGNNKY